MTKHTQAPWFVQDSRYINSKNRGKKYWVIGEVGTHGCRISKEDEANARHLVHCVNAHDELVEACNEAMDALEWIMDNYEDIDLPKSLLPFNGSTDGIGRLRIALQHAESEE